MENVQDKKFIIREVSGEFDGTPDDWFGIFLCRKGRARVLLDSRVYCIESNHLFVLTPFSFVKVLQGEAGFSGIIVEVDRELLYGIASEIPVADRLRLREHPCVHIENEEAGRLNCLVTLLKKHAGSITHSDDHRAVHLVDLLIQKLLQALFIEILGVYSSSSLVEEAVLAREDRLLNRFIFALHSNFRHERTVNFYANELHLTPGYLSAVIKAKSGRTALQWIIDMIIVHAQRRLVDSKLSIKEIADELNFPDQSTFGRYFKKHCGLSPTAFRRQAFFRK